MTSLVTVLRSGGEYDESHVERLHRLASQYAPHWNFICLTDVNRGFPWQRSLTEGLPGWWSKLELFRPGALPDGERCIYMDLDTELVGNIGRLADIQGDLLILRDFTRPGGWQSSVMAFTPGPDIHRLWHTFAADPHVYVKYAGNLGDQGAIEMLCPKVGIFPKLWQEELPGWFVSYKVHCTENNLPQRARVVVFHGKPRPWEVNPRWSTFHPVL